MIRKFNEFLSESKRISQAFDPLHAEEYFANLDKQWDSVPTNAREWKAFTDQYQELCDAYEEDRLPKGVKPDPNWDIIEQITDNENNFKRSLYEVIGDAEANPELERAMSIAGISIAHCNRMLSYLEKKKIELENSNQQSDHVDMINKSNGKFLTVSEIKKALRQTGLKGWSVQESSLDDIGYDEEDNENILIQKCKHKIFGCYREAEHRSELWVVEIIAFKGYFEIFQWATDRVSGDHELTPNAKLADILTSI
jgi:hypothetical protein